MSSEESSVKGAYYFTENADGYTLSEYVNPEDAAFTEIVDVSASKEVVKDQVNPKCCSTLNSAATADAANTTEVLTSAAELYLPAEYNGKPVTEIGEGAFSLKALLVEKIHVPPSVKVIHSMAFFCCVSLKELYLDEGLMTLGEDCITGTSIETLSIPSTLIRIDKPENLPCEVVPADSSSVYTSDGYGLYKRDNNNLSLECVSPLQEREEYAVLDGCTIIQKNAFSERTSLRTITFPRSVCTLMPGCLSNVRNAFTLQKGICNVNLAEDHPFLECQQGYLLSERNDGSKDLIRYFKDELEIALPLNVKCIYTDAFLFCNLETLHITHGTLRESPEVMPGAFCESSLSRIIWDSSGEELVLPGKESSIHANALDCIGLDGHFFDYEAYDQLLLDTSNSFDRLKGMLNRLKKPDFLYEETAAHFRESITENLMESLQLLINKNAYELFTSLVELSFFQESNIHSALAFLHNAGAYEFHAYLMSWKNRHITSESFDYSL